LDRELAITDRRYPARLRKLKDAPRSIFVRGILPHLSPSVAIVGTRRPSDEARIFTEELAFNLARAGLTVISGGALGIDGAAHRGAVRAKQGTIVVLPTSLASPSPHAHAQLFDEIIENGGAWISEHNRVPRRSDFRVRNRLIAALADLVIVAQAGARSGTLHTITAARKLKKTIAAIPWAPQDPRGHTNLELLKQGAPAIASTRDVFKLLGLQLPRAIPFKDDPKDPTLPLDRRILALLTREGPRTADRLASAIPADTSALLAAITELELAGKIAADPSGKLIVRST
jgi:DNA processing protein